MNMKYLTYTVSVLALGGVIYVAASVMTPIVYGQSLLNETYTADASGVAGKQIVVLLAQLKGINFNSSILKDETFKGLADFTVPVQKQNVGRVNPFLPVGRTTAPATTAAAKKTTTGAAATVQTAATQQVEQPSQSQEQFFDASFTDFGSGPGGGLEMGPGSGGPGSGL